MSPVLLVLLLGAASAARPATKTLLAVHRGPDDDNLVNEMHNNSDYKVPGDKPTDALEKTFVGMDINGDRKLNVEELMFRQYATGCEPVEAQVRAKDYMRCGDLNKDNWITMPEFEAATKPAFAECIKESAVRRAHGFVRFFDADQDMDGFLTPKELHVGLIKLWGEPGMSLEDDLMKCADKNKDGKMDQDEFHDSICTYNPMTRTWQMWTGTSDEGIIACMEPAFKKFDAAVVFAATDKNKDGKISESECYDTMTAVNGHGLQYSTSAAIFKAADADKNGFLNLDEFTKAGEAYKGPKDTNTTTTGLFLSGHAKWDPNTYDEGYGMSVECYSRERGQWRVFSDDMGRVQVTPKKPWTGNVTVKQR